VSFLFYAILITRTLISFSTESWFQLWLRLEINIIVFIPLIINKNNSSSKRIIIYFIIQSFARSLLLMRLIIKRYRFYILENTLITLSLLTKLGIFPIFFWFPEVIEGLIWIPLLFLGTWQKLIPLYILRRIRSSLIIVSIFFRGLIGAVGIFNLISIRKILRYSSINNIAWISLSITRNNLRWIIFLSIYSFIIFIGVILLIQMNISSISQLFINYNLINITNLSLFLLSLGGIPPLLGFIPKWLIILRSRRESYFLVLILIFTSLISIFIYIRIIYPYIIFSPLIKYSTINIYQITIGPILGLRFLALIPIII